MQKKSTKQLASALMALIMTVATTMSPLITTYAAEIEGQVTVEPEYEFEVIEETTTEAVESTESATSTSATEPTIEALAEIVETTAALTDYEEETLSEQTEPSGEDTEESSANETRGPDEETTEATNEIVSEVETPESLTEETVEESSEEETKAYDFENFTLKGADRDDILAYIAYLSGDESDAFYEFVSGLSEEEYILVWIAQYGPKEDVISSTYGFDYDAAEDLEIYKYIEALSEDEKADFIQSLTFEQYKRYLSILEMAAEIEEKDFSGVIEEEEFTPDRTWDYASYDAFAESLAGISLKRTENSIQFFNTYVDQARISAGITIDKLLDSNADWYSNDYILSLNPEQFKETAPVYQGSDGNYYVVSAVPVLNGTEAADFQPATSWYNELAEAFTDITYLGNGVYRIPESRYKYCFTEQYYSDAGSLYGVSYGLRIQVLYGYDPAAAGTVTITADVLYPDMTERFLPAVLDLAAGTATVKVFADSYEDTLENYLVSASINRGENLPESVSLMDNGKTLQFVLGDARTAGSLDIVIGHNTVSKYSMAAEVDTDNLYGAGLLDKNINTTAEMYNGSYLKVDKNSVPSDLAVGDKFVYVNAHVAISGVNNAYDGEGNLHVGAASIPTHDAQSFCLYTPWDSDQCSKLHSWFVNYLNNPNHPDPDTVLPGSMIQMTLANIQNRAASNGTSVNLGGNRIFGYLSDGLGSVTNAAGKTLNLEGTRILLSCMHAWYLETVTPPDVVASINGFAERTAAQSVYAEDTYCGNYYPNLALQCTSITENGGYTYATFKVITSMLGVRGVQNPQNYQCAFATLRIAYETPKSGYLQIHKTSASPEMTNGNSCYSFDEINYGIFSDQACANPVAVVNLDKNGYSPVTELTPGTYYIREATATPGSGYKTNATVYPVTVKEGTTADKPLVFETKDEPLNDPFGIHIVKEAADGDQTADLSGAEYTIKYYAGQYTMNTLPATPTTTWVIKTVKSASGYFASLDDAHIVSGSAIYGKTKTSYKIPLGTITVQETKAPAGFTLEGATVTNVKTGTVLSGSKDVYLFNFVDENSLVYLRGSNSLSTSVSDETAVTLRYAEQKEEGVICLYKKGKNAEGVRVPLKDTVFGVYASREAAKAGTYENRDSAAALITTNSDGWGNSGALPGGRYWVKEIKAAPGYKLSDTIYGGEQGFLVGSTNPKTEFDAEDNERSDGGLVIRKTGETVSGGADALAGAVFGVFDTKAKADAATMESNEAVVVVTTDADGEARAGNLPAGSYWVKELKAPEGYALSTKVYGGTAGLAVGGENALAEVEADTNLLVRGELSLRKVHAETGEALAAVPFKITNRETGETHYFVTGADGRYSSKAADNRKANANDAVLSRYGEKDIIPQSVVKSLDPSAGIFFGGTAEAAGSLPYGTYTITELKTEALKNMKMYTNTFTIASADQVIDLGTIRNVPMQIGTTLVDANEQHSTRAVSELTLTDHVQYRNLDAGKTYHLEGVLYAKDGDALTKLAQAGTDFVPEAPDGSVDVTFTFDASALAGRSVVAFEELTQDGYFCAEHKDKDDEGQTVSFPDLKTTATSADTEDHVTGAAGTITITDTVAYSGLQAGEQYTVTGTLMDQVSGEAVLDDNREAITAEKTFTAAESSGSVDITFTFAGVSLAGRTVVAFETLSYEGRTFAVHADLNDADQTVYIPEIHTSAKDATTGIDHTEANPQATIIDMVYYSHLLPGKEYTMTGTLMNKATGEPIEIDGKAVTSSTTFITEKSEGSVEIKFVFNAKAIEGTTVVAFESLDYKGIEVAVHADIDDEDQTVYIPKVRTTALADDTKGHVTGADKEITITDTVSYEGLKVGQEYTVKGTLMDKATGDALLVDGEEVTAETTFTPEEKDGIVDITFTFNAAGLAGTTTVVFETLYTENVEVGVHADIDDEGQTVYIPEIHTSAKDATTGIDHTEANPQATIIDMVYYSHLLPGKEYTMTGTLMNKATGKPIEIDGKAVTSSTTFIAEKSEGSVEIKFVFNAKAIEGTTVVAFESLDYKDIEVAVHADIEDQDQTVYIPKIRTTAISNDTSDHVTKADEEITLVDTVKFTGLEIGREYTLQGILMNQATGDALLADGEKITAETTFTPEERDGSVDVTFTFDASTLAGSTTVVFETLYTEGVEVGVHADLSDAGQTVYIPEIHTSAKDGITGINHTEALNTATIIDTVFYSHLLPGKEYTMIGTLMNKATGEPIEIDDKAITSSTTFTAEKSEGSVEITFVFNAKAIEGTTVVAFETLEYKGIEIAVHADLEDEDQTVYIPKIRTTALASDTKDHVTSANEEVTIVDTVPYEGLKIGQQYTFKGTLMDQATGKAIQVDGKDVVSETTFTPEEKDGSINVTFTFNASALEGVTTVVFETLYTEGKEVAVHADIEDEKQTIHFPEVHTTAKDGLTGDHDGVMAETTTVIDEVFYTNLIPGKEYTVNGKLMVKESGEALVVDGKEVTSSVTFTAEEADGSVILTFTFSSLAMAGKHVVAFEELSYEGISVAVHADIEDEDQTVSYPSIKTTAADQASGTKTMALGRSVVLTDTVSYTGLTAGKSYVLKGVVVDKATGETIGVTSETTFTAQSADGSADVVFTINTEALQGKNLVVFEKLYDVSGNLICSHEDINDEGQSVTIPVKPNIPPVVTGDNSSPMPYIAALVLTLLATFAVVLVLIRRKQSKA